MTKPFEAAFARPVGSNGPGESNQDQEGLSKREYFAAMAMQGLLANPDPEVQCLNIEAMAVVRADALIRELNK